MESCRDSFACDQRDDADYDDDNEKGLSSPALSMMMPAEKAMKVLNAKADSPATRKRCRSSGAGKAYDVFAGLTTSSAAFSFLVTVLTKLVAAHCGKSGRHSQNQWRAATLPKKSGSTGSFARRVAKTRPCTVCRAPCQMLCRQCRLPHCRHHLTGTNGEELRCWGCDARRLQPPIFG